MKQPGNQRGFTLIEIIVTLLLLGMMGIFGTMIMANMAKSFNMAKDNAHLTQKAQVALTRIALEVAHAHAEGFDIDANTISYDMTYDDTLYEDNIIELSGTNLQLGRGSNRHTLTDQVSVSGFTVTNGAGFFTVELKMTGSNKVEQTFSKDIAKPDY